MSKRYFTTEEHEITTYNVVEIEDGKEVIVDQGYDNQGKALAFLNECKVMFPQGIYEIREIVSTEYVEVEDVPPWMEDPQDY